MKKKLFSQLWIYFASIVFISILVTLLCFLGYCLDILSRLLNRLENQRYTRYSSLRGSVWSWVQEYRFLLGGVSCIQSVR